MVHNCRGNRRIEPCSIKDKFSLAYEPTNVTTVTVKKGTTIRIGEVAPVEQLGTKGGGFQVEKLSGNGNGNVVYGETKSL